MEQKRKMNWRMGTLSSLRSFSKIENDILALKSKDSIAYEENPNPIIQNVSRRRDFKAQNKLESLD